MFKQIFKWMPILILGILFFILSKELLNPTNNKIVAANETRFLPEFRLPNVYANQSPLTNKTFLGKVSLLTVWSATCSACLVEHPLLMKLSKKYNIPFYGIVYGDEQQLAQEWLQKYGNPFQITGIDANGDVALDLGIYGTPESFIINKEGKIVDHFIGAFTEQDWRETIYPTIQKNL